MKYVLKTESQPALFRIDYSQELNPSQYRVVTEADGPCLVLAGAGSGKTRTLIYRVAYLLEKAVRPEEILLVTFTNKAAAEMRNRLETLLHTSAKGLWCGTFHHIGNRTLRHYAAEAGLPEDFGILDEEDSRDLMKACAKSLEMKSSDTRFPKPRVIQDVLSFSANAKRSIADVMVRHYAYLAGFVRDFERVKALYEEKKRKTHNLDYDDLLLRWIELLEKSGPAYDRFTRQFRYVLVDEYQDTNRLQHELIRLLSARHRNVLVVGDDAQSIYSFRAAEIKNILDFPENYPNTKIFKLETNYRSTRAILDLANHSIRHNVRQFPKTLHSVHAGGALPQFVKTRDARQQGAFVAQKVLELNEAGTDLSRIAVLFRAHYQAAELELELAKRGVPYLVRGGIRFFEQAHIKDVLSYLKILSNPLDEIAWIRALTLEPGIGGATAMKLFDHAEKDGADFGKITSPAFGANLPLKAKEGLSRFKRIMKQLLKEGRRDRPDLLIEEILDQGYNRHVLLNFDHAQDRLEDLKQLANFAHTYKNTKDFLADATLKEGFRGETLLETTADKAAAEELVLSTIHQAKGLEWQAVFVIGLSEGQFPHAKSMENPEELEEERRLFYVAVTRAKEELVLVHPMTRYDYSAGTVISRPSAFISELPHDAYEEVEIEESQEEETIYLE